MGGMDAPARSSMPDAPPSSGSLCPGCAKTVDPLRAGHVAVLGGSFRYFCGLDCKRAFLEVASTRTTMDAVTADPPRVIESGVRAPRAAPEEADDTEEESDRVEADAEPPTPRVPPVAPAPPVERGSDRRPEGGPQVGTSEPPPATLRSPAVDGQAEETGTREVLPASGESLVTRIEKAAPIVAIGSGLLSATISLAGDGAAAARLPLALFAAGLAIAEVARRRRDPSDPSAWVVAVPIAVASLVAILARVRGETSADAHAAFVALAAAAALVVDHLVARARRDVEDARARVASALSCPARTLDGEDTSEVDADSVRPGQQIVVEPGEAIAVDGVVVGGNGEVAPWLDATTVLEKREGDPVVAGATLLRGRVRVRATSTAGERAWLRLAEPASSRIDVAAPLVVLGRRAVARAAGVSAALVASAVYASHGSWSEILTAACSGGLLLGASAAAASAGLAHARGQIVSLRHGIVFKDANAFDVAARADIAVVCSRGTILLGEPELVAIEAVTTRGISPEPAEASRVLALAAGAEASSTHPIAAAILRAARARGVGAESVRSTIGHSGLGVTGLASSGDKVIVGSRAFLLQQKVSVALADARVSELEAEGRSVLLVALGGRLVGLLALQDGLRPGARAAVQRMHDARIEPVLLSGEARDTVETIARSLGVDHVRPEILPADRAAEVRALAEGGHVVATVGHASSDDGALGAANVSIAMSAAGGAPGEWGAALASDDVRDAALALSVPRVCRERAKAALVVGAVAQAVVALAVAFALAPPTIAPIGCVVAAALALAVVRDPTAPVLGSTV